MRGGGIYQSIANYAHLEAQLRRVLLGGAVKELEKVRDDGGSTVRVTFVVSLSVFLTTYLPYCQIWIPYRLLFQAEEDAPYAARASWSCPSLEEMCKCVSCYLAWS